jgi:hypothetical protein
MKYRSDGCKKEEAYSKTLSLECPRNSDFMSFSTRDLTLKDALSGGFTSVQHCILCKYSETVNITLCSIPKKLPSKLIAFKVSKTALLNKWSCKRVYGTIIDEDSCNRDGKRYPLCGIKIPQMGLEDFSFLNEEENHILECSYIIDEGQKHKFYIIWSTIVNTYVAIIALLLILIANFKLS